MEEKIVWELYYHSNKNKLKNRPSVQILLNFSILDDKLRSNFFLLLIVWEDGGKKKSRINGVLPSKKQQVIGLIV